MAVSLVRRDSVGSGRSMRTDTTWRYSVFGPDRLGRGPMLFTGPDGIRDHQVSVDDEHRYVGEGTMSPEGTSEVDYLWRAPRCTPFPRPKSSVVGEIGWGIPQYVDWNVIAKGRPIRLGEFRQTVEDRHTHLYQNAWYPSPNEYSARPVATSESQPRALQYDRYGRYMSPNKPRFAGYSSHPADTGYHTGTQNPSRGSSAGSAYSNRSLYSHYSDSFPRPKTALPHY